MSTQDLEKVVYFASYVVMEARRRSAKRSSLRAWIPNTKASKRKSKAKLNRDKKNQES